MCELEWPNEFVVEPAAVIAQLQGLKTFKARLHELWTRLLGYRLDCAAIRHVVLHAIRDAVSHRRARKSAKQHDA